MGFPFIPGDDSAKNLAKSVEGTEQTTVITPVAGQRKMYAKSDGWYEKDSAGTERRFSGDVTGPASSVDSEIALFSSTTGKVIKRATGTGYTKVSSGVLQTPVATIPSSDISNSGGGTGLFYEVQDGTSTATVYSGGGSILSGTPQIVYYLRRVGKIVTFAVKLQGTYNVSAGVTALGITLPSGFSPTNNQVCGTLFNGGSNAYQVFVQSNGIAVQKFNTSFAASDYGNSTVLGYISGSYIIE